ncbi:MAG: glycosyl hydrolase family 28-related protein, partial [Kiritimatiellales bacterium]
MSSSSRNNRYRRPGTGLLAGFLFFFAVNLCSAMIHVNAVDYGVNGSDGLDDSPAFQSAINALFKETLKGGYLYIPNGTYDFNSLVSKYVTGGYGWTITIQGQSRTGVVLRCNNTNGVFRFTYQGRAENLTLRDVTFKANVAGAGTAFESSAPPPGGTP